jgi:hypothetical protein
MMARAAALIGGGKTARRLLALGKRTGDWLAGSHANQFCGLIVKV